MRKFSIGILIFINVIQFCFIMDFHAKVKKIRDVVLDVQITQVTMLEHMMNHIKYHIAVSPAVENARKEKK